MKKLVWTVALLTLAAMIAAGCNTTKGAGRDLQKAGQGIQNSADRHGAN